MAQKFNLNPNLVWPLVILVIAFGAFFIKPWQTKPQETISVSAQGKTQVTPNVAKLTATIETQNPNLDTARSQNQQKVSILVDKLKALGIEEKDIKTENISAGPGYEAQTLIYPDPKPNTNQISTTIEVTIRNFDISDEVLAALTQNGATNLYGPNLTVDDQKLEEAKAKARDDAVESARKKAEQLAKASGRKAGKVVKIQEAGDFGYPYPLIARSEADLKQQAAQIQPGRNEVTITLQVDFSLK
ncbi:MAG: SIMPL domain-containing protein [Candidatus Curtissbacteria bacterium]|nr:SIMPL domain-containing protein [Candidatus Curtissbacteria bacterium]